MVKARVERKPRLDRGPRLIKPTEMRQRGGEIEMRAWMISVDLDRATEPRDRLLVGAELQLGEAREHHPNKGVRIARTEAECLLDMGLGLRAATKKILGETDVGVRISQISIQRQCLLAFSNALGRAVGEHFDVS